MNNYTNASTIQMCQALLLVAPNTLLPKLRKLTWRYADENIFQYIHLFLGPNLAVLSIGLDPSSIIQLSLLCTLPQRHPHIQRLEVISFAEGTAVLRDALTDAVCIWHELRALTVPDLTPTMLAHLSNLPNLSLINISSASAQSNYPKLSNSLGFPALQALIFDFCDCLKAATATVEAMSSKSCHLQALIMKYIQTSTMDEWKYLFSAAQKHCNHGSLRNISMSDNDFETGDPVQRLKIDTLRPLFVFSNLSRLTLNPDGGVDLSDADLRELAQSCPHLKHLELGMNFPGHPLPRTTLSGLVCVAQHCPFLHTLCILVDARTSPAVTDSRPGGGVRHTSLVSLGIGGSPIGSEVGVAVFLSDLFPCVRSVDAMTHVFDEDIPETEPIQEWNRVWDKVNDLLPILAAVRNQERSSSDSSLSDEEP